jgi:hypothetical protein
MLIPAAVCHQQALTLLSRPAQGIEGFVGTGSAAVYASASAVNIGYGYVVPKSE